MRTPSVHREHALLFTLDAADLPRRDGICEQHPRSLQRRGELALIRLNIDIDKPKHLS
jgi:hypothetical protein